MPGTWGPAITQSFLVGTMRLLTDGTLFCNELRLDPRGRPQTTRYWWLFRPNSNGDYQTGSWSRASTRPIEHLAICTVLPDGRVLVAGTFEIYRTQSNLTYLTIQIYSPRSDRWFDALYIPNVKAGQTCCVLADGRVLLDLVFPLLDGPWSGVGVFDPATHGFQILDRLPSGSAVWTLLPDGSMLSSGQTALGNRYAAFRFLWDSVGRRGEWVPAGDRTINKHWNGPAILLPNGRVFTVSYDGVTQVYTPPGNWVQGPSFPARGSSSHDRTANTPAVLLPNGAVLCVDEVASTLGDGPSTHTICEYLYQPIAPDREFGTIRPLDPPYPAPTVPISHLMLLPTGQVLCVGDRRTWHIFTPEGEPFPAWRPRIATIDNRSVRDSISLEPMRVYQLSGTRLTGMSEAVDQKSNDVGPTNYPLVRLRRGTSVIYCPTFGHRSTGVATEESQLTHFEIGLEVESGPAQLCVAVNGIECAECIPINILAIDHWLDPRQPVIVRDGDYIVGNLADGGYFIVTPHGIRPVPPWEPMILTHPVGMLLDKRREFQDTLRTVLGDWSAVQATVPDTVLEVRTKDQQLLKGKLIGATDTTVTIGSRNNLREVKRDEIHMIREAGTSSALISAAVGAGVGLITSYLLNRQQTNIPSSESQRTSTVGPSVAGTVVGASLGYLLAVTRPRVLIYEDVEWQRN